MFNEHFEYVSNVHNYDTRQSIHLYVLYVRTNLGQSSISYPARDVCKISLWLVEYISNQNAANFGRISNSIEISLVGRAPGGHYRDYYTDTLYLR